MLIRPWAGTGQGQAGAGQGYAISTFALDIGYNRPMTLDAHAHGRLSSAIPSVTVARTSPLPTDAIRCPDERRLH
jgi:hypothetical protein